MALPGGRPLVASRHAAPLLSKDVDPPSHAVKVLYPGHRMRLRRLMRARGRAGAGAQARSQHGLCEHLPLSSRPRRMSACQQ